MQGAYKGRIHVIVPFIGRKNGTLTAYNLTMTCTGGIGHPLSNRLFGCGMGAWLGTCGVATPMSCTQQPVIAPYCEVVWCACIHLERSHLHILIVPSATPSLSCSLGFGWASPTPRTMRSFKRSSILTKMRRRVWIVATLAQPMDTIVLDNKAVTKAITHNPHLRSSDYDLHKVSRLLIIAKQLTIRWGRGQPKEGTQPARFPRLGG